jgi:hypothetical protein
MNKTISRIIAVVTLAFICATASAQSNPFDKYADTKDVTYIYISKAMLGLIGSKAVANINGIDINEIISKLNSIQIITSGTKSTKESLKSDAQSIVKKGKYEILMQVSENDRKVDIYHKESKDNSVIVMITDSKNETVLIVFSGTFSTANVMKMLQQ